MIPSVPPVRIVVAAAQIDVTVTPVGVEADGTMEIPADPDQAGWYRFGPDPESAAGTTVVAAHVDSVRYGVGPFSRLKAAPAGSEIIVTTADGIEHRYTLESVTSTPKSDVPLDEVFDRAGAPRLLLITCGGQFDRAAGHYFDNVIAAAIPS